jgi:hypothetical protein
MTRSRIKKLAVPPAWTEVWICPWPNGHIQAIGVDAAGRRQYRYHDPDVWQARRDREKFERTLRFAEAVMDRYSDGVVIPTTLAKCMLHGPLSWVAREAVEAAFMDLLGTAGSEALAA